MTAHGYVRVETEERLIAKIGRLPGFSLDQDHDALWYVTSPLNSAPKCRRFVVVGSAEGLIEPEGMQAGHGPGLDQWTIACGIADTNLGDASSLAAKRGVQDALNAIADMLAADHRITLAGEPDLGVHDVAISRVEGPLWAWGNDQAPLAWADFDISASALIRRNP